MTATQDPAMALVLLGALVLTAGCHQPALKVDRIPQEPPVDLTGTPFDPAIKPKYMLYPSDKLLIRYPTDKDLDQEVRIRSDGKISLPYVGEVEAAFRAPEELSAEINEKSKSVLANPRAIVIVVEEVGRTIYIDGQVQRPGQVTLHPSQTLMQTIIVAGGINNLANAEQVLVIRTIPNDATYVLSANLKQILAGRATDVRLEPFDIIHVPQTIIAQVDQFVEQYINLVVPRAVSFPFMTQLHNEPLRIISNKSNSLSLPVNITAPGIP